MKKPLLSAFGALVPVIGFLPGILHAEAGPVTWNVDIAGAGPVVSPTMHGIFFEDINYAGDGGLYAELVENRSFEHKVGMHAWTRGKTRWGRGNAGIGQRGSDPS